MLKLLDPAKQLWIWWPLTVSELQEFTNRVGITGSPVKGQTPIPVPQSSQHELQISIDMRGPHGIQFDVPLLKKGQELADTRDVILHRSDGKPFVC
jgi:hypothetical protein